MPTAALGIQQVQSPYLLRVKITSGWLKGTWADFRFFHFKGAEPHAFPWPRSPGVWEWLPKASSSLPGKLSISRQHD